MPPRLEIGVHEIQDIAASNAPQKLLELAEDMGQGRQGPRPHQQDPLRCAVSMVLWGEQLSGCPLDGRTPPAAG